MSDRRRPSIYNIAAHGGFADALAQGLIDRFAKDVFGLARGLVILPNNRAQRALQEAFVRLSENGLLLPQMAVIGDLDLDESIGVALDSGELALDIAPAVDPMDRLLTLAQLIQKEIRLREDAILAKDALRLAREFARTLDQLTIEEISLADLMKTEPDSLDLSSHWQDSYRFFLIIAEKWRQQLEKWQRVDQAARRNALFDHIAKSWKTSPPDHFVVAAGITTSAPAIARFLETISFMPAGMVVLPDLDLIMPDEEWDLLGPFQPDPDTGYAPRAQETHPQYQMKLLLDRMSIARGEIMRWPRTGESGAAAKRSRALSNAFAIPKLTVRWQTLESSERSLAGVQTVEASNSAEEAQIIALLAREALEDPDQRVAIVTPDRSLATRISAHLKRWDIQVDDTAGQPLAKLPEGVFFLNLLAAVADGFPPAEFLALLKHPLVQRGERRLQWLDHVRKLDLLLRGPRPAPGLAGIDALLKAENHRTKKLREAIAPWWQTVRAMFAQTENLFAPLLDWPHLLDQLRQLAETLTEGAIWSGPAGRELAELLTKLQVRAEMGPIRIAANELAGYFETLMSEISVRPPYGGHPRIALYGLLEARLQQSELVICCGLNEGSWPQAITPDPWLAPMIRKSLGLPAQERQIGLSAHDLVGAMGARKVILSRARRDDSGPAIASRFLLRLKGMCGDYLKEHPDARVWLSGVDQPDMDQPSYARPAPMPSAEQRHVPISVTQVDSLIADPYSFYAKKIMGFASLDLIDADPSAAWRGTIIHDILDQWAKQDNYAPGALRHRAQAFLNDPGLHPLMRSLWAPRLLEGLDWIADTVAENRKAGREPLASEIYGKAEIAGVELSGIADRIDRMPDNGLAIVDYKTGGAPSNKAVIEGYNLQLGLLAAIAELGGFKDIEGEAVAFEYWSLAKKGGTDNFGHVRSPTQGRGDNVIAADAMVDHAVARFNDAADRYLKGAEPMTAKLHPEYARYADYDQLMRLEEWYGRAPAEMPDHE
ncbi:MAG: double-strand break repair protein AddB [Sphingomonadales bacterium]|nr:double-strand break repair protein AddB [Sphingomonadales bacterium]PIX66736.1 MAG: double-strand break repair protein AddB [Sphingomonadales bacterium CG_4_10_14_3_um_filter_58_15]NCO47944.1 double-strand break repair protein AddB [Sphingomonadales bacterium]NCP01067.1 double-strand break repair protein AddB [Sphingomonadales bacterium]NCP26436.1 double-strand break repair protein AddB [Sphingomonadales bacterium]